MSTPLRLMCALNYSPPGTQTRLHSSFQTLGSPPALSLSWLLPLLWAGANLATCHLCTHLRLCMKLWSRILDSVNYESATYTPADWVRLFETRFSLHLRKLFPEGTGSLLSFLARVPSGVLASLALCLANDFVRDRPLSLESTPSRIGSTAWFLSCLVWVSFLLSGLGEGKASLARSASLDHVFVRFLHLLSLASHQDA